MSRSAENSPSPRIVSDAPEVDHDAVTPLPGRQAAPQVLRSAVGMFGLLRARRLHHPRGNVGLRVRFADGSNAEVYRETRVGGGRAEDPALLVVGFVLRGVHGRAHLAFRLESWLNIPMFVGFPGLSSKLWMTHDEHGCYRGIYEWDGAERAVSYVRALSWVLGLVSVPGSIKAHIVPGIRRDDALSRPDLLGPDEEKTKTWWKPGTPVRLH